MRSNSRKKTSAVVCTLAAVVLVLLCVSTVLAGNSSLKISGLNADFTGTTEHNLCVAQESFSDAESGTGTLTAKSASGKEKYSWGIEVQRTYSATATLTLTVTEKRGVIKSQYFATFVPGTSLVPSNAKDYYISIEENGSQVKKFEESITTAESYQSGLLSYNQKVVFTVYNAAVNKIEIDKNVYATGGVTLDFASIQFIPYYQLTMDAAVPAGTGSFTVDASTNAPAPRSSADIYKLKATPTDDSSSFACWYVSENGTDFVLLEEGVCGVSIKSGASTSDEIEVTLTKDVTIQPRFISNNFATTFMPGTNGTITVSGEGLNATEITDSEGQNFGLKAKEYAYKVTAAPSKGYLFTGFHIEGQEGTFDVPVPFDRDNQYTLVMQLYGAGCTVTPQFARKTSVTLKAGMVETVDFKETGTVVTGTNPVDPTSPQMTYRYSVVASGGVLTSDEIGAEDRTLDVPAGCTIQLEPLLEKSYIFSGWYKSGVKVNDAEAIYDWASPAAGETLQPYCMDARDAAFQVGSNIFNNWDTAMRVAKGSTNVVILIGDITLKPLEENATDGTYITRGNDGRTKYVIPDGVRLIIPYQNGANTFAGSNDVTPYANTVYKKGTGYSTALAKYDENVYLTLTVAGGADIQVGSGCVLTVGGMMGTTAHTASSYKLYGKTFKAYHSNIQLLENGGIRVQSGGVLSSCGFIYGAGTVTAESGSNIYQPFAIMDFGGGGYTVGIAAGAADTGLLGVALNVNGMKYPDGEVKAAAPFLRYTTNNIQADLVINHGAYLRGYVNLYANSQNNPSNIILVGTSANDSMIALSSGAKMTASYDRNVYISSAPTVGKSILKFEGGAEMGHLTLTVSVSGFEATVDCAKLTFPMPYNYEIQLNGTGSYTISKALELLPGATIVVSEDATLTVSNKLMVFDGLNEMTTGSVDSSDSTPTVVMTDYAPQASGAKPAGLRSGAYPKANVLEKADGINHTANLIVNGKLILSDSATFGGLIQTDGSGKATVTVGTNTKLSNTEQVGAVGSYKIDALIKKAFYAYAGATRRTLTGQIMSNDATPVALQKGQTYFGTAADKTLSDYSYTVYYLSSDVNRNETKTENLNAPVSGQWYQKSVTYYLQTFIGSNLVKTEKISEKFYLNNETAPLDALPTSGVGYAVDASWWYTDANCTKKRTDDLSDNEKITLYAKRSADKFTITAKSADMTTSTSIADVSLDGLGTYNLTDSVTFNAPKVKNYTFKGWFVENASGYSGTPVYTGHVVTEEIQDMVDKGLFDTSTVLNLVAVYTKNETAAPLTLKLDKAPSGVTVEGGTQKSGSTSEWEIPIGTEVTITVPDSATNFQYWTNANDKVMSKEPAYTFTMVTNTTLTAETSTSSTFVIFQSADGRLLKADTLDNIKEFPAAPYRVGYTFAGWKVGSAKVTTAEEIRNAANGASPVIVTAAYNEITAGDLSVTVYVGGSVNTEISQSNLSPGAIATFEAPAASDGSSFRFWASDKDGTNILSFSQKYSFRVTKITTIYAIYGGENKPEVQPVVRVDNVLKNDSPQSLTFMIGASIPENYTLVEMGALYTKNANSGNDTTLRVEDVGSTDGVYKAVSRLKYEPNLTDYSYALGFKISEDSANTTIHLRGYVAVRKASDNTIYYYYSGVTSKSYNGVNTQQGG